MKRSLHNLRQAGFSLIELMVSMAIGLLVLSALIALMLNVSRNNTEMTKTNQVIENGRLALQLLQTDLSHAGYWGGFVPDFEDLSLTTAPTDLPTAVPNPCQAYTTWDAAYKTNLVGIAMQAYEIPAVVPSPTLSVCAGVVTNPKANTDVLVVRHAENCVAGVGNCPAYGNGNLYFQVARNGTTRPSPGYLLTDATTAAAPTSVPAVPFTLQNRDGTTAELRKFISNLYYVRNFSTTAGDGIPTLMRSQFQLTSTTGLLSHRLPQALVEGVEGFRVEFGVDNTSDAGINVVTGANPLGVVSPSNLQSAAINWAVTVPENTSPTNRGDGSPDGAYIRCTTAAPCTAAQLRNVVAAKIYVLIRSIDVTPGYINTKRYTLGSTTLEPFNDGFKRHLFSQTIRLVNVSARRETP